MGRLITCPRCNGSGKHVGYSSGAPDEAGLCPVCLGSGNVDEDKFPRGPAQPGLFEPGEAMALTRQGLGSVFKVAAAMVGVSLPIVTLVIVVTWWSAAHEGLRSVLEVLPESVVARTADGPGQPWVVAAGVLALTVVAVVALSLARRRALRDEGRITPTVLGLALARAVTLVGGVALAATAGPIAAGADLADEPTVFAATWHIVLVLVLILAYVWLGSRHVAARVLGPSGAQEHSPTR